MKLGEARRRTNAVQEDVLIITSRLPYPKATQAHDLDELTLFTEG